MGKHIWNRKSTKGKKPEFGSSDELWRAACEYFEWATDNPLIEERPMNIAGELVMAEVNKPRVFTFAALCLDLDIGYTTYKRWRTDETLAQACEWIDAVVYTQKFEGAAAGLFNAGIISRDLNFLNDNIDHEIKKLQLEKLQKELNPPKIEAPDGDYKIELKPDEDIPSEPIL